MVKANHALSNSALHVSAVYANLLEGDALYKQIMQTTKDIAKVAFTWSTTQTEI